MSTPGSPHPDRRAFLQIAAGTTAALALDPAPAFAERRPPAPRAGEELTVRRAAQLLAGGRDTARDLVARYAARARAVDRRGPTLRAVLEENPDAPAIAAALDEERRKKGPRGPLHGVPILLKANIATADRMGTTAGSLALAAAPAPVEAALVRRLRDAGCVILGKTNLSEWANFRSTRSSSGWSSQGGQTRNPYALDRSPSGSSSGSGAAASADLCVAAVGTETDGSIVSPAAACGLVGIKPTVGLVSRAGIIPISRTQDTAGPMARTVEDAALLLAAMAGPDPADPATSGVPGLGDVAKLLDAGALQGARLGVARNVVWGRHREADRVAGAALQALQKAGATLVDVELPGLRELEAPEMAILLYEFKAGLHDWLARLPAAPRVPRTLDALIRLHRAEPGRYMPFFDQEIFEQAAPLGPLTTPAYLEALAAARRLARAEGIDAVMDRHRLDALVCPTQPPPWLIDLVNGDPGGFPCASTMPAVAGYPHVTVPAGLAFGLPIGLSFFGRAGSDAKLIRYAYAFERAHPARVPPRFLPTVSLD